MYGDGGFYFLQPVTPGASYGDGGFYFTQPVSPTGAAYAGWRVLDYHQGSYGAFHAARIPRVRKSSYGTTLTQLNLKNLANVGSPPVQVPKTGNLQYKPKAGNQGASTQCKRSGVWYLAGLDPCGARPSTVSASEWKEYQKTGKVPQIFAYSVPAGPRNCTDAAVLYKVAQETKKLSESNPLLQNLRVATDDELKAMWCAMVTHNCMPDPEKLCGDPDADNQADTPEDKSEAGLDLETEEGFFAKHQTTLLVAGAVAAVGAVWFAMKKGVL